jgi:ParB/RepB/Spo0J family partition protein
VSAATVMPAASATRRPKKAAAAAAPSATPQGSPAVRNIALTLLDDHPDNPRSSLTAIEELAQTIAGDGGLLQALVVVPSHRLFGAGAVDDGRFTIVAGHRRRAAVTQLGWTEVRCEVREDLDARAVRGAMLTENLQRVDLTPLEEAEAFDKLVGDGWSQRAIAAAAGCTQPQVSKRLLLLRLEASVQQAVRDGSLSVADAVEIGKLPEARSQKRAYERMRGLHSYRSMSVVDALREEQREVAREERYEQACSQVKASGWSRVTSRPAYSTAEELRRPKELAAHQKGPLACHAVYVETSGAVTHYCTAPKRHGGKAKDTSPQAEKERRDKRERKRAMELRAAAAAMLAAAAIDRDEVLEQLTDLAFVGWIHSGAHVFATEWLRAGGWANLPSVPYSARQFVAASSDEKLRSRFLGALLLGHCEGGIRELHRRWGRQEALYLHRLTLRTRYSPTDWERERLRDQCGILDVEAFLSSADPLPHLPGQPTLHDDLGTEPATQTVALTGDLL